MRKGMGSCLAPDAPRGSAAVRRGGCAVAGAGACAGAGICVLIIISCGYAELAVIIACVDSGQSLPRILAGLSRGFQLVSPVDSGWFLSWSSGWSLVRILAGLFATCLVLVAFE